jgi:hypothetical protein
MMCPLTRRNKMKNWLKYSLIGLLVVVVLAGVVVGILYFRDHRYHHPDLVAVTLGLKEKELQGQIRSGKTVEELAEEAGISPDEFQEKMQEAWEEDFTSRLEQALKDDRITQEQYDWLKEGVDQGYLGADSDLMGFLGWGVFGPGKGILLYDFGPRPGMFYGQHSPGGLRMPGSGLDRDLPED